MSENKITSKKRVDCRKCQHFFVTWEPNKPMGCKMFGFKSQVLPSIVVFKSSGSPCYAFKRKKL